MGEGSAIDAAKPKSNMRKPGEIKALLIEAAQDVFAEKGYAGASTREIALRAGVSEPLLFKHFKRKSRLFELAVLEPFNEFFEEFIKDWRGQGHSPMTNDEAIRRFITGLYDQFSIHRKLVMALVTADAYEDGLLEGADSPLSQHMDELIRTVEEELSTRDGEVGWTGVDLDVAGRLPMAMVVGVAVLDPWLFPSGPRHPSRERILEGLIRSVVALTEDGPLPRWLA